VNLALKLEIKVMSGLTAKLKVNVKVTVGHEDETVREYRAQRVDTVLKDEDYYTRNIAYNPRKINGLYNGWVRSGLGSETGLKGEDEMKVMSWTDL